VLLGSTKSDGVTSDLFASGEARWLGVQTQGQQEQPRVLMVSVPYALKAVDAETLGGKPASAYLTSDMLAGGLSGSTNLLQTSPKSANLTAGLKFGSQGGSPPCPPLTGAGILNYIPLWTPNGCIIKDSILQQNAPATEVGIGAAPVAPYTLDIPGSPVTGNVANVRIGSAAAHPGTLTIQGKNAVADDVVTIKENNGTGIFVDGNTGTGINIASYNLGTGIVIQKGAKYGLIAQGQFGIAVQGSVPYNNAGALEGVLGSSATDTTACPIISNNDGCAGVVGVEYGSNNDTVGVYGFTASSVGAGVYGQSVSSSSVLGVPPDPSAAVWGDSSQQVGVLGTSDANDAVFGLNSTVNDPTSPTAYFENDSNYDTDLTFQTSGFNNPNPGGCTIDTAGDLSCDRTLTAANISTGSGGGNTDLAGSCTLAGGTCTQPFSQTYSLTPFCVATDTSAVNPVQVVVTLTGLTINGTNGDVVNYICIGQDSPPPMKIHHEHRRPHRKAAAQSGSSEKSK
jgi:trimeric autotransporter adhesin